MLARYNTSAADIEGFGMRWLQFISCRGHQCPSVNLVGMHAAALQVCLPGYAVQGLYCKRCIGAHPVLKALAAPFATLVVCALVIMWLSRPLHAAAETRIKHSLASTASDLSTRMASSRASKPRRKKKEQPNNKKKKKKKETQAMEGGESVEVRSLRATACARRPPHASPEPDCAPW